MADFPSPTSAYGVWSLNEIRNAIRGSNWPVVAVTDEYFANVSLLLHGDGTNGAQNNTFLDSSANSFTITRNGNATQGSFSPYSVSGPYDPSTHGGSGYFDTTGGYLSLAANSLINIGTDQFNIECWVYLISLDRYSAFYHGATTGAMFLGVYDTTNRPMLSKEGTNILIGPDALPFNEWVHIAASRDASNTLRLFVNGTLVGSTTSTDNFSSSTMTIPRSGKTDDLYISDLRIVKGTALYTSSFTPPTAPLTAVTNTSLLCNFTNAGIFDSTGKNVLETVGNAQIDTTTVKYGTGAMEFDGTGDYLAPPASDEFAFGTGDFTIEAWVYFNAIANNSTVCCTSTASSSGNDTYQFGDKNGHIAFTYGTTNIEGTTSLTTGTWYHVAATRQSGTVRVFLDGVQESSGTVSSDLSDNQFLVGVNRGRSVYLNGFIDDLRITKGVARYTANFTPPTEAFPDQGTPAPVMDYLIVAGGGGGGDTSDDRTGGGGGAGGLIYSTAQAITSGTYTVTVGSGGANRVNGQDSSFNSETAIGGGCGDSARSLGDAGVGGSGGGAYHAGSPAAGTTGQGNAGGNGYNSGISTGYFGGGGGGGADAVGGNADSASTGSAGVGGAGKYISITGSSVAYAGGGGGGAQQSSTYPNYFGGTGGIGGGGNGGTGSVNGSTAGNGDDGTANTGGGGGGSGEGQTGGSSGYGIGGSGGSGIVIIRTLETASATTGSPTITTDGSYNIYTFTGSGSITF